MAGALENPCHSEKHKKTEEDHRMTCLLCFTYRRLLKIEKRHKYGDISELCSVYLITLAKYEVQDSSIWTKQNKNTIKNPIWQWDESDRWSFRNGERTILHQHHKDNKPMQGRNGGYSGQMDFSLLQWTSVTKTSYQGSQITIWNSHPGQICIQFYSFHAVLSSSRCKWLFCANMPLNGVSFGTKLEAICLRQRSSIAKKFKDGAIYTSID